MKALIFDVDGTMAETESLHREAFNAAFEDARLDWHWDEALYGRLLAVAGGKERIRRYWRCIEPDEAEGGAAGRVIDEIHAFKTRYYTERVRAGALTLRPGIARLVDEANHAGLPLAIATTTTPDNIDALLATAFGKHWRQRFSIVCDASSATAKKPAPDVYLAVLRHLGLAGASCLALEDSENGLLAARAAGVPVVITTTAYTAFQCFDGALRVLPELGDPGRPVLNADADDPTAWIDLAALRRMHDH